MEVKQLSFAYRNKRKRKGSYLENVLNENSFSITEGKITTIIGANGCGKSTLLKLMTKNLIPNHGKILLNGKNIRRINQKEFARMVAVVHQNNKISGEMTVEQLVSYGRTPYYSFWNGDKEKNLEIVEWAMAVTNIKDYRNQAVETLSGGQRQRVFIAMALAQKTKILFLDEPTTYLDIRHQIELLEMIQTLNKQYGITIIMVLHDINHALYYSDEVIGLKEGKLLLQGKPDEVITEETIEKLYDIHLKISYHNQRKIVQMVR